MKKLLYILLAFLSVPAFAEVDDVTVFDFANPTTLTISPEVTYQDGSFNDVLRITNKILTSKDIQISFTKGVGNGGVIIINKSVEIDGEKKQFHVLEMRTGSDITIRTTNGCELDSVKFTGSIGSLNGSSTGTSLFDTKPAMWKAATPTDTVKINNAFHDTAIETIEVYYKKPSKPLIFQYSTPSSGSEVTTFSTMTLNFNLAVNSTNYNAAGITLTGPGISTPVAMTPSVSGSSVTLSTGQTYTAYGDYTVSVPAGAFKNSEGGSHEAISIPFRVNPKRDILTYTSVSPAEGTVNELPQSVDVLFKEYVSIPDNSVATFYKDGVKQFTAPLALTEGNTKSVTISHNRETITEEGVWTIEVPAKAIYNGMMGDTAEERWNPAFTLTYTVESAESQELKVAKQLKQLTDNGLMGYPTAQSDGYAALSAVIGKGKEATTDEIKEAIGTYYKETNVKMPVDGKWYRIAGINSTGSMAYLTYADQKVSLKSSYTSADAFQAVAGNGYYEFKTKDEHYLTVPGNPSGFDGFVYHQSGKAAQLQVAKLQVENADSTELIGKFSISGWLGRNANDEDLGNSTAAVSYPSFAIVQSPTESTVYGSASSSAFIFEETSEPVDPTTSIETELTFDNNLVGIKIEKAGDPITLVVNNVQSAEISDATLPYFEKQSQIEDPVKIDFAGTILTPIENSFYKFSVNTNGLEAGEYILYVPAETFNYTPKSEYTSVVGTLGKLSITIKEENSGENTGGDNTGGDNTGGDNTGGDNTGGGENSGNTGGNTDTDKPNFSYTYPFAVDAKYRMSLISHPDVVADVWLNDLVFYSTSSSIVPNPDAQIQITNINGQLLKTGHLEAYPNYKKEIKQDYLAGTVAVKLVLDNPFKTNELKWLRGMYYVNIPREALGDTNFGKWLKNPKFTGTCVTNEKISIQFFVDDNIIDILGIDEVNAADDSEQKIYDLTGRRLENMKKPGVYIVNGKKIMVK